MKKKLLALFIMLAMLVCLLPAAAVAAPQTAAAAETTEDPAAEETPADAALPEEEEDADPAAADAEDEDAGVPEADPEVPEQTIGDIAAAAELASQIEPDGPIGGEKEPEYVTVLAEDIFYAYEGMVVFNNGGTVYNNLAVVYNNGGTVYNNEGTVYNNGGVVYANGGKVCNNGGKVYNNDALIYSFDGEVEDARIYGYYEFRFGGFYEPFMTFDGLVSEPGAEKMIISEDSVCSIAPYPGFVITNAEADSGEIAWDEDGGLTLSGVTSDVTLTLTFQAEAPAFNMESGSYAEAKTVEISGPASCEIWYTTDGSDPVVGSATLYEEPFTVEAEGCTVKAIAFAEGADASEPAVLTLAFPKFTAPEFDALEEGYYQPKAKPVVVESDFTAVVKSVALAGENPESFRLSSEVGRTIVAGKADTTTWTVRPGSDLKAGEYTALVVFTLDSGETVEVPISFTVTGEPAAPAAEEPAPEAEPQAEPAAESPKPETGL